MNEPDYRYEDLRALIINCRAGCQPRGAGRGKPDQRYRQTRRQVRKQVGNLHARAGLAWPIIASAFIRL